jgi:membrane-associated PAP2 superfamily phosphatase
VAAIESTYTPLANHRHNATASLPDLSQAWLWLAASASLILLLGQYTDIDLALADLFYDSARGVFPWDTTWFATKFMHGWVKNALRWIGFAFIALALIDLLLPEMVRSPLRSAQLRIVAAMSIVEPLVVKSLKDWSAMHCPWGVDRYGGSTPFLRLLDTVPAGWDAGHCFPAGHASTAMWLCSLAVFWLPHAPRKALGVFLAGSGAGLFLGWVQQMRGQHFMTHTLWTTWIATALFVALLASFRRRLAAMPNK